MTPAASVETRALCAVAKALEALARAGQTGALADHPACLRLAYERFTLRIRGVERAAVFFQMRSMSSS